MGQRKTKTPHNGGIQLPLPGTTPESSWQRPAELPDLRRVARIALDRETKDDGLAAGWGPGWARGRAGGYVCGTSVAWREGDQLKSAYFPVCHEDTNCFDPAQVRQWEIDHQRAGVRFAMQNAPYDVGWGAAEGVPVPERVDDAVAMANMVDEQRLAYDLNSLCEWRGVQGKDDKLLKQALASYGWPAVGDNWKKNLWRLPARYAGPYAEADALGTLQVVESLDPILDRDGVRDAYQLEMDLLPMVHAMRLRGVRVDLDAAERALVVFRDRREQVLRDLSDHIGQTTGIHDLRRNEWLDQHFTHYRLSFPKEGGRGSFEAKWMRRVDHWLPKLVCDAKAADDAAEKFIKTYVMGYAWHGRLHATINQFKGEDGGTRTFRLSYSDPPLQQMPHRDELLSTLIRGVFLPEPGEWWLAADYSQQEYRLIVHFAEKYGRTKAAIAAQKYRDDPRTDFHSMVAEMTGLARKPAKDSNFAKSYGAGIEKFAAMIDKPAHEARRIMEQYDGEMPFVSELFKLCQTSAEKKGYILLLDRARIHFDTWEPTWLNDEERRKGWGSGGRIKMGDCSREEALARVADPEHPWYRKRLRRAKCRKAMNAKIQGSAARQTKLAMRACWRAGYTPLLQMHDELGFSLSERSQGDTITEIMRDVVQLQVPMMVDAEWGRSWGDATHEWDERGEPAE